jgi:dTDP-4-dehydrorhamnose 3,5-epimerase-like enzyme
MPPVTTELPVDGSSVTTIDRFGDSRGYFNELYNVQKYDESLHKEWKQVSFSSSQKHALRGLHCSPHGKFITCVRGAFYDVVACVDTGVPGPPCCAYVPGTRVSLLLRAARTERSAQLVRRGLCYTRAARVTASSLPGVS